MKPLIFTTLCVIFSFIPQTSKAQYYQQDKKLHIAAGGIITASTFFIIKDNFPGKTKQETIAKSFKVNMIILSTLAVSKEILDYNYHKNQGTWNMDVKRDSFNDIAITLFSGLTISAVIPLIYK